MAETKKIKIPVTCEGTGYYDIDEFHNLQGMLKELSEESYGRLKASLTKYGFRFPIFYALIDGKKFIIDAHQRIYTLKRMRSEGYEFDKLPAVKIEAKDRREAKEVLLAMNSSYGEMTTHGLYDFLKEDNMDFEDFSDFFAPTEFTMDELREDFIDIEAQLSSKTSEKQDDSDSDASAGEYSASENSSEDDENEPEITIIKPVIESGDLIELPGGHRILCGSSLDAECINKLMDGKKADMMFTDPPYNYAEENKLVGSDVSQAMDGLKSAKWDVNFSATSFLEAVQHILSENCSIYVCTSHHLAPEIWAWMKKFADFFSFCIWSKTNPMPSLMKRHWTWDTEIVCYATKGKHTFNFPEEGHCPSTWRMSKNIKNEFHPTQKPIHVPEHAIVHSSNEGDLVADFFGGSGCTLLACRKVNRVSYTMEQEPKYCQVMIERFLNVSGDKNIVINGKSVNWEDYRSSKE